ncbi:hypothetical protein [Marinobacterium aestuariivivens]|uniref:Uncharacterized protein n=1 Tax=Marinobacterium aestuariivivens TaxID=1698799 RepID=A0ABW2A0Z2_9GAMM
MKRFKDLLRSMLDAATRQTEPLDAHTRSDIGLDPMAAEHLKDERLWCELAA